MKLSTQEKLELIKEAEGGEKIVSLCQEYGISRFTFYKWYKRWLKNHQLSSLEDQRKKGDQHWKGTSKRRGKAVLETIIGHPSWSTHKIAEFLTKKGLKISNNGVWGLLKRRGLNREERRIVYQKKNNFYLPKISFEKFSPEEKLSLILTVADDKQKVSSVCRRYGISRFTFYKWYKRWQEDSQNWQEALLSRKREGEEHWRFIKDEQQECVLKLVLAHPEYSVHRLSKIMQNKIGHHGIQNILARKGLNTYQLRRAFVKEQAPVAIVRPVLGWFNRIKSIFAAFSPQVFPAPPPLRLSGVFWFSFFFSALSSFLFLSWIKMLSFYPVDQQIGLFLASLSLLTGTFFFVYSMKYYLSMTIVLSFSRHSSGDYSVGEEEASQEGREKTILSPIKNFLSLVSGDRDLTIKIGKALPSAGGLQPNVGHIKIERYPFFSIHLPLYNEKSVAERVITACLNMDYASDEEGRPNFEVIVCDDSNDETVKIIKEFLTSLGRVRTYRQGELFISEVKLEGKPTLKVIHRQNRTGFKGAALANALQEMDSRTEFVCVFDADFVPYPDSLEQFLKYFKSTGSWDEGRNYQAVNIQTVPYHILSPKTATGVGEGEAFSNQLTDLKKKSPVACIAGYQWHVLNKSENWITRGVRTEYAGSYVVERSSQEILGALKIIHGSVYCIRADVLKHFGWGRSITEDYEMTLRLYEQGLKVVYTPYIQAPSECVSTLKRLVRQRMRWAEGHSYNTKKMGLRLLLSKEMTFMEKLEFLFLSPYYLQSAFFIIGTLCWFASEAVFKARLPFWTSLWGWSLVLTNLFALPLINSVGLFLEEAEKKDYLGIFSFVVLSYLLVPFQAYASVKGFIEKEEGPWFRTPKTGTVTDIFTRRQFYRWLTGIIPWKPAGAGNGVLTAQSLPAYAPSLNSYLAIQASNNRFTDFKINRKRTRWLGKTALVLILILSLNLSYFSFKVPLVEASPGTQVKTVETPITNGTGLGGTSDNAYNGTFNSFAFYNGTPYIIEYSGPSGALVFVKCGDDTCTSGNIIHTVDGIFNYNVVGKFTSLQVVSGIPYISY